MILTHLQQAIVRHLSAHPFFSGAAGTRPIAVIAGNDKSLLSRVETSMARLGLCVIVYPIGGDFGAQSATVPYLDPATLNVRVRENIVMNRGLGGSGQPADYVAEVCASLLQHHTPAAEDGQPLSGGGIVLKGLAPDEDEKGINAWNLIITISAGLRHDPQRLDFGSGPGCLQPPP